MSVRLMFIVDAAEGVNGKLVRAFCAAALFARMGSVEGAEISSLRAFGLHDGGVAAPLRAQRCAWTPDFGRQHGHRDIA